MCALCNFSFSFQNFIRVFTVSTLSILSTLSTSSCLGGLVVAVLSFPVAVIPLLPVSPGCFWVGRWGDRCAVSVGSWQPRSPGCVCAGSELWLSCVPDSTRSVSSLFVSRCLHISLPAPPGPVPAHGLPVRLCWEGGTCACARWRLDVRECLVCPFPGSEPSGLWWVGGWVLSHGPSLPPRGLRGCCQPGRAPDVPVPLVNLPPVPARGCPCVSCQDPDETNL